LGVEYARAYWRHAADRARRRGLENVRVLHCEAGLLLRHYVAADSLRRVHVYFPDPWPKKRHHKRRLIQSPTLRLFHRALEPGGEVRLATDHGEYFEQMQAAAAEVSDLFERLP